MLFHYAREAGKVFSADRMRDDNYHKPGGLWLSDDAACGWRAFVLERLHDGTPGWENAGEGLRYSYGFEIVQLDQVLRLETSDELRGFLSEYGEATVRECVVNDKPGCGLHIEWGRVKAAYKGILITPFHQNLPRTDPDFHWYKGWDCASGCFWNLTCLKQVTQGVRTNLCDAAAGILVG